MKISELIKDLQALQGQYGDMAVWLSADEEGNTFTELIRTNRLSPYELDKTRQRIIIYPYGRKD